MDAAGGVPILRGTATAFGAIARLAWWERRHAARLRRGPVATAGRRSPRHARVRPRHVRTAPAEPASPPAAARARHPGARIARAAPRGGRPRYRVGGGRGPRRREPCSPARPPPPSALAGRSRSSSMRRASPTRPTSARSSSAIAAEARSPRHCGASLPPVATTTPDGVLVQPMAAPGSSSSSARAAIRSSAARPRRARRRPRRGPRRCRPPPRARSRRRRREMLGSCAARGSSTASVAAAPSTAAPSRSAGRAQPGDGAHPDWLEVDLNPVIAAPHRAITVDALIVADPSTRPGTSKTLAAPASLTRRAAAAARHDPHRRPTMTADHATRRPSPRPSTLYFGPWYRRCPFFEKTLEAGAPPTTSTTTCTCPATTPTRSRSTGR